MFNRDLLIKLRKEANLTQRDLAEASGVPYGTIASIESGHAKEPSAKSIRLIANVLNAKWHIFFEQLDCHDNQETQITPTEPKPAA